MDSFDYRKYVPLGLIALVLLLPIIVWSFSEAPEDRESARGSREVGAVAPGTSAEQSSDEPTDRAPAEPSAGAQPTDEQPGPGDNANENVFAGIDTSPSPDRFPPPPRELAAAQIPPGYEALAARAGVSPVVATSQPDTSQPDTSRDVFAGIDTSPSPDRFPPPPRELAAAQIPPGYEALAARVPRTQPSAQPAPDQQAAAPSDQGSHVEPTPAKPEPSAAETQPSAAEPEPSAAETQPSADEPRIAATKPDRDAEMAKLREELTSAVDKLGKSLREGLSGDLREAVKKEVDKAVLDQMKTAEQEIAETVKREVEAAVEAATAELQSTAAAQPRQQRPAQSRKPVAAQEPSESSAPDTTSSAADLPIDVAALKDYAEVEHHAIGNLISLAQLNGAIRSGGKGLELDFESVSQLLDGTQVDPTKIYGTAYFGPYPFEAAETRFSYKRFRPVATIRGGRATLDVGRLLSQKYNSENWTDRGTLALRVVLWLEQPGPERSLGSYDTFTAFLKTDDGFQRQPWLIERPAVNRLTSDDPTRTLLSFRTDEPMPAVVLLGDGRELTTPVGREHVVPITQLPVGGQMEYRIRVGQITSRPYSIQAAPARGAGPVTFAYCGDSREGVGTGEQAMMGINYQTLQLHAARAYGCGAQFFLFGGDLINGYTTSPDDFRTQLAAWKQAMAGFWAERPVYPAMGNHEALLRVFKAPRGGRVMIDRWPYDSASAEAVFAREFLNPENAPAPSDPRRPTYNESVFTFQFGLVRVIAFNNNYWYSDEVRRIGGSPEGYMFDDQLRWIERWLDDAERDPTVKYVVLFAQEPVFPCGGHAKDAMWYHGDNNVRAYTYRDGELEPERDGILDVRNRFAMAVSRSSKVAAVLCSDEHSYYRVLIDRQVPVGDPRRDDRDRDGVVDWKGSEPASPLESLPRPVWYMTSGGGGAPYYAEEHTPWTDYWRGQQEGRDDPRDGFFYSSQENVILFHATDENISAEVVNPFGERIDVIDNLMRGK